MPNLLCGVAGIEGTHSMVVSDSAISPSWAHQETEAACIPNDMVSPLDSSHQIMHFVLQRVEG